MKLDSFKTVGPFATLGAYGLIRQPGRKGGRGGIEGFFYLFFRKGFT